MSPSKAKSNSAALSERSPNTSSPSPKKAQSPEKGFKNCQDTLTMNEKPVPRFELNTYTIIGHDQTTATYISPSDAIRSPTTKKLSEIKGKRFQYVIVIVIFAVCTPAHACMHACVHPSIP